MNATMLIPLILKLGAAPLHQWLPSLAEGLPWTQLWLILTIQKINPLILISTILSHYLIFFILASALIGSIIGLAQYSTRKLITYSAIANLAWALSALFSANSLLLIYFTVYSMMTLFLFLIFKKININTLTQIVKGEKLTIYSTRIGLLSLGGLPPFTGFAPKIIIIEQILKENILITINILMVTTLISLFFYIRIILLSIFYRAITNAITFELKKPVKLLIINISIRTIPIVFILALYKL